MSASTKKPSIARFTFNDPSPVAPEPSKPVERTIKRKTAKTVRPPSRDGKRSIACFASEETWEQLSILSIRQRRPIQDLLIDALDLLFQQHGLSRIARERIED